MSEIHVECGKQAIVVRMKYGGKGNYISSVRAFSSKKSREAFAVEFSNPFARDLLRIGQSAFIADRAFRRKTKLGQQTRQITVRVPVEDPAKWETVAPHIKALANFVSQDRWAFEFTELKAEISNKPTVKSIFDNTSPVLSCVNLFSDGLDSLCGAAEAFNNGETPVFVSHTPPGIQHVRDKITELKNNLKITGIETHFVNFRFILSDLDEKGKRNMFPEHTRRTRPLLYLTMAGAVALELGIPKIMLNENGVLAVNLPFQPHLSGPRISRHAHPQTLKLFETVFQNLWEKRFPLDSQTVVVANLFSNKTKSEELTILRNCKKLARKTISCEYARQQMAALRSRFKKKNIPFKINMECGLCVPCLVRRSAMELATFPEDKDHYAFDARNTYNGSEKNMKDDLYQHVFGHVKNLYSFCKRIKGMNKKEFVNSYMAELSLLPCEASYISKKFSEIYDIYQRFATEFINYIGRK